MANSPPYRTSNDLISETLANLGVLAAGQSIAPEDFETISEKLDSIFRMLGALEIVYVADSDNIPPEWFAPLADIVAGECASKFGVTADDYMRLVNRGLGGAGNVPIGAGAAVQSLKMMMRGRPTFEPLRTESF